MEEPKLIDILEGKKTLIDGLLDGKGYVKLVDVSPRLCPEGYSAEFAAVRAARCSFGLGLKDPLSDQALLKYLIRNYHTSPLEMANITFLVKLPTAICVHFLRHRTGHFNQFREGSKLNKQSSVDFFDKTKIEEITKTLDKANELVREIRSTYHTLIKQGLGKEIARFYLPNSEYTTIYMQFDLNNLMKMLSLRMDQHTQHETCCFANAMFELAKQVFPVSMSILQERMNGVFLIGNEIEVLKGEKSIDSITSISEKKALKEKAEALGITL